MEQRHTKVLDQVCDAMSSGVGRPLRTRKAVASAAAVEAGADTEAGGYDASLGEVLVNL